MILNSTQERMLRWLVASPRTTEAFTGTGALGLLHSHAERYLAEMERDGYAYLDGALWHATEVGREYAAPKGQQAASHLWGPWSTPAGSFVPPKSEPARGASCMAAYRIKSLGIGA